MAFPERFLEELTAKTDMTALVSNYTALKRQGSRLFACCPFHSEKTPSFTVTPETGLFYCFGCHAGGGPVQFVMRAENLAYPDAVRFLAARAGLSVPEDDQYAGVRVRRERLLDIQKTAARWFYDFLGGEAGRRCAEYLGTRAVKPQTARRFGLGYAPDGWDRLLTEMTARGMTPDELTAAGLVSRGSGGKLYDAFRDRLMFPIFDLQGNVIAFSGRALSGSVQAKYKNSSESPLYQKRSVLYGAHLARKSGKPYWILCEGNADVVSLHQAGFSNAVATCGTALTDTQARLIARHVNELVIVYDADAAGQAATQKAVAVLEAAGLSVRVPRLEGAKDPDEFIRTFGGEAFESLLAQSQNHTEYRLSLLQSKHDISSDAGKLEFLREAVKLLAALPTQGERELYAGRTARTVGIDAAAVSRDAEAARTRYTRGEKRAEIARLTRPAERTRSGGGRTVTEEHALTLLLRYPEMETALTADDFSPGETRDLFMRIKTPFAALPDECAALAAKLTARTDILPNAEAALRDCEKKLRSQTAPHEADPLMAKFTIYRETKVMKEEGEGL